MRSRNVTWPFSWWWSESQPHGHNSVCKRKWLLWTLFYRPNLKCKFPTSNCETESKGKETKQLSPVYEKKKKKRMNWHKSENKGQEILLQYFVDGQLSTCCALPLILGLYNHWSIKKDAGSPEGRWLSLFQRRHEPSKSIATQSSEDSWQSRWQ